MDAFPLTQSEEEPTEGRSLMKYPLGKNKIPIFLEFSLTMTKIVILAATIFVAAASIIIKVSWLDVLIRTGITIFVLGIIGFLLNWFLGKHFIDATLVELKELEQKKSQEDANVQVQA